MVLEGEPIQYSVSVEPDTLTHELIILFDLYLVDEFGNIGETTLFQGRIEPNRDSTNYSIPTTRNYQKDGHFHYFVRLLPGNGYRVDSETATGSIQIIDADSPVGFSIEAVNRFTSIDESSTSASNQVYNEISVIEGESANFAIRSHQILSTEQEIIVEISETGDFLTNTKTKTVLFPVGQHIASFDIPTIDDELIEVDGLISVQIRPSDSYAVAESPHNKASVVVEDNDQALPGIMVLAQSNTIVEGQPAQFFIKSSSVFERDQSISMTITDTGDFLAENITNTITLLQGERSVIFEVPTIDDYSFESNGTISVSVDQPSESIASYNVIAEPFNSASVAILDNDPPLGISILPVDEVVEEGEAVWFQLTSTPPLTDSKTIDILIEQVGDFMAEATIQLSVNIASLNSETKFNFPTIDDDVYEADGVVSATIQSSDDFNPAPSYQTASVSVLDNDLPEVSISSVESIIEGEAAEFNLLSTLAPYTSLQINLGISQEGEFITGIHV